MKLPTTALSRWQWIVSILLLLATMINYMDRQVLANMSVRITEQLSLSQEQYGNIEWGFGTAFAVGSLAFGFLVDLCPVRLLYPAVLLAWSAVGFITGFVWDYYSLLGCRLMLGFFEAGHWPCALVVTQSILSKQDRAFGNSILQSGASLGAILTPIIIAALIWFAQGEQAWRTPFQVVGCVGLLWATAWMIVIPRDALKRENLVDPSNSPVIVTTHKPSKASTNPYSTPQSVEGSDFVAGGKQPWLIPLVTSPKFWALTVMIIGINTSWQLIRAWLPKFLQQGRGYSEYDALWFNSAYYIATDIGCIAAGFAIARLSRQGRTVHSSRLWVYGFCAMLAGLTCLAAVLPHGALLLFVLLIVGAGALGVFPSYYSFTQELSSVNLGKATGLLAFIGWIASSPVHRVFGRYVDETKSFDLGIALVGLSPLAGLFAMLILWPREADHSNKAE